MITGRLLLYLILFVPFYIKAQNSPQIKVYKGRKYEFLGRNESIALHKKLNSKKYYFSTPTGFRMKRLNYFNIIHKTGSTYRLRENCRELRKRKIKLYEKHKDGEYFLFKVFSSYIQ